MAVTKTNFINYSRCPRYVSLASLEKEKLNSMVTLEDYKKEEEEEYIKEILGDMYDGDVSLLDEVDEQLEVMLPYYNKVEILAGDLASKYFSGTFRYSKSTYEQESFDFLKNNIRYLCYVDIYNENDNGFNIIEVKATTMKKFLDLGTNVNNNGEKKVQSIFEKDEKGIYHLLEEFDVNVDKYMPMKKYELQRAKLFNRYSSAGHYVYDLAVQRYIIENDLKNNNEIDKIDNIRYYLAVLNSDYIFDGKYLDGEALYDTDSNGNDIICFIDLTNVTKDYMDKIDLDRKRIEGYIKSLKIDKYPLGEY